ncbi:helix-turn-helix domain-containing protein [Hymenobacter sp. BT664]|uniref:Helix-turn-helix domain-containing protein n=1 Tax=Hymenobacter montanus TaxID=2771359 RepID=A0A927BF11_9BACT|nr:helix-turn-helix domain-containing protein [Hymenobacter montanus]MBD2769670.1 helix-turn-helix domain-containing protein [Hymenobacter montanus]
MQPTIIVQGITVEQLREDLRALIRFELAQAQPTIGTAAPSVDELLTVPQAAALLDVCVATVFEWKRRGLLVSTKIGGRTYLKHSDVLSAGTREQRTQKPSRVKGKPPA